MPGYTTPMVPMHLPPMAPMNRVEQIRALLVRLAPDSLTYSAPLIMKRHCDICTATFWINPLVAPRSFFVCARKLAQKHTSIPPAPSTSGPTAPLRSRSTSTTPWCGSSAAAPGRTRWRASSPSPRPCCSTSRTPTVRARPGRLSALSVP